MMEKGLVSVVIPTYNRAGTIERAVDSVLAQDYPSVEVIVVDDGSRDNTPEIFEKRYGNDQRVRYFRIPNGGVCVARNRGLREVRGEFVAMLDSDDYWLPGKLSLQIGILKAHPSLSMVWSDMDAIDTTGEVVSKRYLRSMYGTYQYFPSYTDLFETEWKTDDNVPYYIGHISKALAIGNIVHTSTLVVRADRLAMAGEYDQSVHPSEDQDCYYRISLTGAAALADTATIHYQIGAADAASGDSRYYELATSSLMVFNKLSKRMKSDLLMPQNIIRKKEADLYQWVGYSALRKGLMGEARLYLLKRIIRSPLDIRSFIYLIISCTPYSMNIIRFLQKLYGKEQA